MNGYTKKMKMTTIYLLNNATILCPTKDNKNMQVIYPNGCQTQQ